MEQIRNQKNISPEDRAEAVRRVKNYFETIDKYANLPGSRRDLSFNAELFAARLGLFHVEQPTRKQIDLLLERADDDWVSFSIACQEAAIIVETGGVLEGRMKEFVVEILRGRLPPKGERGRSKTTNWRRNCMILDALSGLVDSDYSEGLKVEIVFEVYNEKIGQSCSRKSIKDIWSRKEEIRENISKVDAVLDYFDSVKASMQR